MSSLNVFCFHFVFVFLSSFNLALIDFLIVVLVSIAISTQYITVCYFLFFLLDIRGVNQLVEAQTYISLV